RMVFRPSRAVFQIANDIRTCATGAKGRKSEEPGQESTVVRHHRSDRALLLFVASLRQRLESISSVRKVIGGISSPAPRRIPLSSLVDWGASSTMMERPRAFTGCVQRASRPTSSMREDLAEEELGALALGIGEELLRRRHLDDLAAVHEDHVVGDGAGKAH